MPLSRKGKLKIALVLFGLVGLVVGYQAVKYWWYKGYAKGTKSGYLRKLQSKGPPYCKYVLGEVVLQRGGEVAQGGEVWEFSVEDDGEEGRLVRGLGEAGRAGSLWPSGSRR